MCIAAIISKPITQEYLKWMDEDNPHGGGVAWFEPGVDGAPGAIEFRRGLDHKQIFALQDSGTIKLPYLLHFRWATHGGKGPAMTHPFPTGIRAFMGELSGRADSVVIHNGTWGRYSDVVLPNEIPGAIIPGLSDTAVAAFFAHQDPAVLDNVYWSTAHAFLKDGKMDIKTRGNWNAFEGNQYSNLNWLPTRKAGRYEYSYGYDGDVEFWNSWHRNYRGGSYPDGEKSTYGNPYRVPSEAETKPGVITDFETKKEYATFSDYIREKYGDEGCEIMNELMALEGKDGESDFSGVLEEIGMTQDEVSEEFDAVNQYLAKKYEVGGEG